MKEVIDIFKQIQDTSSLNDKKKIIGSNKDNKLFKKYLVFLLDNNIVTGISDKKISKPDANTCQQCKTVNLNTFEDVMDYLKEHNSGRDEDVANVKGFIYDHYIENDYEFMFYVQMVTKKFRLGCDAKVINKVIPGLIPTFDVMLGTPIDKAKVPENTWFSLSQKLNGNRCIYYDGKFYTRQGKEYYGLDHIKHDIEKIVNARDYVFDGELTYKNLEGLTDSEAFQKGTGIAQSKTESKEELKLVLFDVLPRYEFDIGKSKDTYRNRKQKLLALKAFITGNLEIVTMFYEGTDQSQIWKWLDYAETHDIEGLMLSLDAPYECKRTKTLLKVKKFYSCDIRCIGVEEGSGRNKGTLGALICDYKENRVNVGSGFSDADRKHLWLNPNNVVEHIISVKYKEETKNKDGGISIQFPVFECVRFDKDEPSYN